MKLAQGTRLEGHEGSSNSLADGEIGRVDLVEGATSATDVLRLMLQSAVDKGGISLSIGVGYIRDITITDGAVNDVGRWRRHIIKDGLVNTEVLSQDVLGSVCDPIVNVEGRASLVEVTVVKDQEKLSVLDSVDGVGDSLREVPNVTYIQ